VHDSVLDGLRQQNYALGELPAAEYDQGQRPPGGKRSERQGGVLPCRERLCEPSQLLSCSADLGIHALSSIELETLGRQVRLLRGLTAVGYNVHELYYIHFTAWAGCCAVLSMLRDNAQVRSA